GSGGEKHESDDDLDAHLRSPQATDDPFPIFRDAAESVAVRLLLLLGLAPFAHVDERRNFRPQQAVNHGRLQSVELPTLPSGELFHVGWESPVALFGVIRRQIVFMNLI